MEAGIDFGFLWVVSDVPHVMRDAFWVFLRMIREVLCDFRA